MTNTQIETGSRHMQQCRTNFDVLSSLAGGEDELMNNDDQWCMGKDELAVTCNKVISANAPTTANKYAYPSVITCLGPTEIYEKTMLASYYHLMGQKTGAEISLEVKEIIQNNGKSDENDLSDKAQQYREFQPVGYSVGKACAHGYKGDTIASVQIGGLRTVMNGGFAVQTGDLIQMYIPDVEFPLFAENGGRKVFETVGEIMNAISTPKANNQSVQERQRQNFYSRGQGMGKNASERIKTGMFSIKPYMESLNEDCLQYYGDKIRVFARAVSSARPYEPVDIMIARQAM